MGKYTDRLKSAKAPERSVAICLRGDLVAEWEAAERDLERTQKQALNSMEDGVGALVARIEELQAEMSEHTDDFRLRALTRHQFRSLVIAHPPRTGDDGEFRREDAQLGINGETFFPALIRASVFEPELDDEDWEALIGPEGILTDRQFGTLSDAAWFLNRGEVNVPFSHAASLARRSTGTE
jgi:hypothetical protein